MEQVNKNKITNRHIAKLLDRIRQVITLPKMVEDDIVRQMHFLKDDLTSMEKADGKPSDN